MGRKTQAARVTHCATGTHSHSHESGGGVTGFNPPTLTASLFSNRKTH